MKYLSSNEQGGTLVMAMVAVSVVSVLVGIALTSSNQNARLTDRAQRLTRALDAADSALEYAYPSWKENIRTNGLRAPTNSQISIIAPTSALHPGFASSGVTFSNFSVVNANQWGETTDSLGNTITNPISAQLATVPGHPGWAGVASFYLARVSASMPGRGGPVNVTVARNFQITGVPLFQAAIFFEHDIEMHPGSQMIVNGLVHTNNDVYAATGTANNLKFLTNVSYVGNFTAGYKPLMTYGSGTTPPVVQNPPIWADGLPASTSTTYAGQLKKVARMEPFGTEPSQLYNSTDGNQDNDGPREIIEPPVNPATDPGPIAGMRLYNQANVRITIDRSYPVGNANRIVIRDGNNAALPAATDTAIRTALNVGTTTMYDYREAGNVYLTNVDMKLLDTALVGMGASFNGVLYIHDVTSSGLNAIRLKNGAVLSRDLSVASNNAVYIQGDYNTGGVTAGVHDPLLVPSNNGGNPSGTDSPIATGYTKRSTAVMADAVMILSNAWSDANAAAVLSSRVASHTTVNTAILSGIVPTNYQNSGVYSGGPHNFPRFLETWSSKDFTYLGSMIQTFNSQQYDGIFDTGNTYSAPGRKWGFDSQFLTQPPPGTLQSIDYSRGTWARF